MRIGILGSGRMGGKLGTIFAQAGHEVLFSYSRDPDKLERLAREAGSAPGTRGSARAGTPREAAEGADVLVIAVHWSLMDDMLKQAGELSGKVLVTCSLPMNLDDTELLVGFHASGAEELARKAPGARVVSAFGTIPSEALFAVYAARDTEPRPSMVYCGDDEAANTRVAELILAAGFDPVHVGPLVMARYVEPFTLLVARIAYEADDSPALTYRFERLEELHGSTH